MKKSVFLISLVAILAIGASVAWFVLLKPNAQTPPKPQIKNAIMTETNVKILESAVNSPRKEDQAHALSSEIQAEFLQQNNLLLPEGTTLHLKPDTLQTYEDIGQIEATTSTNETYLLHLAKEGDIWLILYTETK